MLYSDWLILRHLVMLLFLIGRQFFHAVHFDVFSIEIQSLSKFLLAFTWPTPSRIEFNFNTLKIIILDEEIQLE